MANQENTRAQGFVDLFIPKDLPRQAQQTVEVLNRIDQTLFEILTAVKSAPADERPFPIDFTLRTSETYTTSLNVSITNVILSVDAATELSVYIGTALWFSTYITAFAPVQLFFDGKAISRGLTVSVQVTIAANYRLYCRGTAL